MSTMLNSFSTDKYFVNGLRDDNNWFCTFKGYAYSKKNPKRCKHTDRIRVIAQLFKRYEFSIKI